LGKLKDELKNILETKPKIDYITISGSGEPTLHKGLDEIIDLIKKISKNRYPVCVITNSSLLHRKDVRDELKKADLVIPSLDVCNEKIFRKINHPCRAVLFGRLIRGLIQFREEYKGKIWLEIMLIKGINDKEEFAYEFKKIISQINPDKVQLNLPTRPTPSCRNNLLPNQSAVRQFKKILDENCEIIGFVRKKAKSKKKKIKDSLIINSLKRRPQNVQELAFSLRLNLKAVKRCLVRLSREGKVTEVVKERKRYFLVK
jgi:wyosine [tRNA(Phe)-imidazoG37] synthetase (radical SAM superfamily)